MPEVWGTMGEERPALGLRGELLIPTIFAGLIVGLLEVVLASSFGALIFSGGLADRVAEGIGLNLFAGTVIMLTVALLSSQPGTIASIQDSPAVILALMAASIAARVPPGERRFLTVVVAIGMTSLATGAFFLLLSTLRLGNLVRFVPYPVVGGFLAGTGWLLVRGGVGVLTGSSVTLGNLTDLAHLGAIVKWVPGFAFAIALVWATRRYRHFLLIPGSIAGAVAAFYVALFASGLGIGRAQARGWLLGPFPRAGLWHPWMITGLARADWHAVLAQTASVSTLMLVALLALLLNASGIELAVNHDMDLNRELRAAGVANLAAGAGGGVTGYHALSLTALTGQTGAFSRLAGLLGSAVCLAALLFGSAALARFPRAVVGGLIVFLGLGFLVEWVWDAWSRLHHAEYLVVVLILVVIAAAGLLTGVGVGIGVALVLFVVNYSRTDVVRHTMSGANWQGTVERTDHEREVLRRAGDRIHVMELQGFIFFGTASGVLERVTHRASDPRLGPLRFLVLDFRRVTGLDSSAVNGFVKAGKLGELHGFVVLLTGVGPGMLRRLQRGGLSTAGEGQVRTFSDLDHGMEWCEDQVLGELMGAEASRPRSFAQQLDRIFGGRVDLGRLMAYLTHLEAHPGEVVIRQGEVADDVYFLEVGRLSVHAESPDGPPVRLRAMGPETVVGELPLYLGSARTATVVAETACVLHRLSMTDFRRMESNEPDLAASLHRVFATFLARRLDDTLHTIQALLD